MPFTMKHPLYLRILFTLGIPLFAFCAYGSFISGSSPALPLFFILLTALFAFGSYELGTHLRVDETGLSLHRPFAIEDTTLRWDEIARMDWNGSNQEVVLSDTHRLVQIRVSDQLSHPMLFMDLLTAQRPDLFASAVPSIQRSFAQSPWAYVGMAFFLALTAFPAAILLVNQNFEFGVGLLGLSILILILFTIQGVLRVTLEEEGLLVQRPFRTTFVALENIIDIDLHVTRSEGVAFQSVTVKHLHGTITVPSMKEGASVVYAALLNWWKERARLAEVQEDDLN